MIELYHGRFPDRPSAEASGDRVPDCLWSLLLACWSRNPGDRPLAFNIWETIVSDPFVDKFNLWFESIIQSRPPNATSEPKHSGQSSGGGRPSRMSSSRGSLYFRSVAPGTHSQTQAIACTCPGPDFTAPPICVVYPVVGLVEGSMTISSSLAFNAR